jgi:predicted glutamine amidotransferase
MCRVLGCVASEPVSIGHELLEAENPFIRQSEEHDSGWGMAVYRRGEGDAAHCVRFPQAAHVDGEFLAATGLRGRIFNAHVRRATIGGLSHENTHPFCLGNYSFSHNGTVLYAHRLIEPGVQEPAGETDSEALFNFLMRDFDPDDAIASLRHMVATVIRRSPFSALNFLFSDGERLYAYRLGVFDLHWLHRGTELFVASERITDEPWHTVQQDVLLVADPTDIEEPHAERLVGDALVERADMHEFAEGAHLRGRARGEFAAARAQRLAAEHT